MFNVAINGLGRIGRATLKILSSKQEMTLVAVNDMVPAPDLAYLLRFDSVYGRWDQPVTADGGNLKIGGTEVRVLSQRDPALLP